MLLGKGEVFLAHTVEAPPSKTAKTCITSCPKGMKAKAGIKTAGFTFCVCDIVWNSFINDAGYVEPDLDESLRAINDRNALQTLWFRTGEFKTIGQRKPAWDIDALVGFDESFTTKSEADKWEVGYIQTIEKLVWEARYDNGWVRKATAAGARDANPANTPAPWYTTVTGAKGTPSRVDKMASDHPTLSDEPMLHIAVVPPDAEAWCVKINSVTVEGKFHLWLIAKDSRLALDIKDIAFLHRATIDMKKAWTLKKGGDPFSTLDWSGTGTQTKVEGFGQGSQTPVLETPIANQQLNVTTTTQGTSCGKKPAPPKK